MRHLLLSWWCVNMFEHGVVSVIVLLVRALELAVWIVRGVAQLVPTVPCQDHSKSRASVKALYHSFHLTGLHHTPKADLDLLKAVGDVVIVDASAAVVNQNGAEAEILGVEGGGSCN